MLADWYRDLNVETWLLNSGKDLLVIAVTAAILYYVGRILLDRVVRQIVKSTARHREWHRKDLEKRQNTLSALFMSMWRLSIIVIAGFSIFTTLFDVNLAPLFASAGIIGVALGFGAQSLIKDFLSGIFIIAENQYRVGDIVDIEGFSGTVERIGTRSTVMRDVDGDVHYFPNGMVLHVINKTMGYSMARFSLLVDPVSDIDHVIKLINETGAKLAEEDSWKNKIIEAPTYVFMGEVTGSSIELTVAGKTQPSDQWAVAGEMRSRLIDTFEKESIKLAVVPAFASPSRKK